MLLPNTRTTDRLIAAYSTVEDGNMSFDYGNDGEQKVWEHRRNFFSKVIGENTSFSTNIILAEHKDNITILKRPAKFGKSIFESDAIVTDQPNTLLFLASADCIPIIAYDPRQNVLALIHAGYKSTTLKIMSKTIDRMREHFGSHSHDISLIIGPAVQVSSFAYTNFPHQNEIEWQKYLHRHDPKDQSYVRVDNVAYNMDQALKSGVLPEKIHNMDIDTGKDMRFYSHVRDFHAGIPDQGRFATICMMK